MYVCAPPMCYRCPKVCVLSVRVLICTISVDKRVGVKCVSSLLLSHIDRYPTAVTKDQPAKQTD